MSIVKSTRSYATLGLRVLRLALSWLGRPLPRRNNYTSNSPDEIESEPAFASSAGDITVLERSQTGLPRLLQPGTEHRRTVLPIHHRREGHRHRTLLLEKFLDSSINLGPNPVLNGGRLHATQGPGQPRHGHRLRRTDPVLQRFNEKAGEYFTPWDVVQLMARLTFLPVADEIRSGTHRLRRRVRHRRAADGHRGDDDATGCLSKARRHRCTVRTVRSNSFLMACRCSL